MASQTPTEPLHLPSDQRKPASAHDRAAGTRQSSASGLRGLEPGSDGVLDDFAGVAWSASVRSRRARFELRVERDGEDSSSPRRSVIAAESGAKSDVSLPARLLLGVLGASGFAGIGRHHLRA